MSDSDSGGASTERELGQATIVYDDPEAEYQERQVANEMIAYFQDHWIIKTGETEDGRDTVQRIPSRRVYYVERDVETFEEEVKSLTDQVESLASGVKSKLPTGDDDDADGDGRSGQ